MTKSRCINDVVRKKVRELLMSVSDMYIIGVATRQEKLVEDILNPIEDRHLNLWCEP